MNIKQSTFLSIKETADYLGVSKKSLMRWDKDGLFASRETISKSRVYYWKDVEMAKGWLDLRQEHRNHLRKLPRIQRALDKVLVAHPLNPGEPLKFWRLEDVQKPYEEMKVVSSISV